MSKIVKKLNYKADGHLITDELASLIWVDGDSEKVHTFLHNNVMLDKGVTVKQAWGNQTVITDYTIVQDSEKPWVSRINFGSSTNFDESYLVTYYSMGDVNDSDDINHLQEEVFKVGLPKLFFEGDINGMTKEDPKMLEFDYISADRILKGYAEVKWQGTSSLQYPKKNFTIKLYWDEGKQWSMPVNFHNWGSFNKYVLKANYVDITHARNVVSANLWKQVVCTRDNIPNEMKVAPNINAIDGFPIEVYINGDSQGLYTFNLGKEGFTYNLDEDNPNHALICNETQDGLASLFRETDEIDGIQWSIEFPDEVLPNIQASFDNMINFVATSNEANFKANINTYLDLEACIDYYIFSYVICHYDGLAKNMLLVTYNGTKWFPSMYDMDLVWGLNWDWESDAIPYNLPMPQGYHATNSLLWEKIALYYQAEIKERYKQLRTNVLSVNNIIREFENFMNKIDSGMYQKDYDIWLLNNDNKYSLRQIRQFAIDRLRYVDSMILGDTPENGDNVINAVDGGSF